MVAQIGGISYLCAQNRSKNDSRTIGHLGCGGGGILRALGGFGQGGAEDKPKETPKREHRGRKRPKLHSFGRNVAKKRWISPMISIFGRNPCKNGQVSPEKFRFVVRMNRFRELQIPLSPLANCKFAKTEPTSCRLPIFS